VGVSRRDFQETAAICEHDQTSGSYHCGTSTIVPEFVPSLVGMKSSAHETLVVDPHLSRNGAHGNM
jgi:hypothetical protein